MDQKGFCQLCGKESKLIRKSHIIPNFMYKGLFDEDRKMLIANLKDLSKKPQMAQSGIFEKNILCENCENIFSKNERYTSHFFNGSASSSLLFKNKISRDGLRTISITGIDYTKLKLCILSILWRAHISKNKFFKNVSIDEKNENVIRRMLLNNESESDDEYKISILGFQNAKNDLIRILVNPSIETIGTGKVALFLINGYSYFIELKPKSSFKIFDKVYLKESGEIDVPILKGEIAIKFLTSFGINTDMIRKYVNS